ncbi:MAG TPA: ABC transporter substrate-binding protein, partial [Acetobacteraceae bacterium]|nr:ABC transporter substrate-binding protein [Acetobacteraceae bacterium]
MRRGALLSWVLALTLAAATPAAAQKSADTLRVAWRDAIPNLDPYYNQLRVGLVLAHQAWDTLIYRDPETLTLKPLLAVAWRQTDPITWEFDLRRGVRFQDGSPLTADDVVYTVETVIDDRRVQVGSNYAWIASAEKIDDHKVRLKAKRVFPAALEYLAMTLPIW